jgi:alpha-N-acetylglucosaminidase
VSVDSFFSGPAFLPWNRMGNLYHWAGPLTDHWMDIQLELQKKILERERAFGMLPVLPAFSGFVPPLFNKTFPHAKVSELNWGSFNTSHLDPMDPLFQTVGSAFVKRQKELIGTDHFYNSDPFNEMTPPAKDLTYLKNVGQSIFKSMITEDPEAKWLLQGWFLVVDEFWQPPQAKALLDSVPNDRLLILDLWAEVAPIWKSTGSFYNHSFIWCMLHDFGGRSGLYGKLPDVNTGIADALEKSPYMMGIGLTPEAIEQNSIMYDFVTDMTWRKGPVDLNNWVRNFAHRRYGQIDENIALAWELLQKSVYNNTNDQMVSQFYLFFNF